MREQREGRLAGVFVAIAHMPFQAQRGVGRAARPGHAAGVGHGLPQGTIGLQPQLQRVVETVAQQRRRAAQAALEPAASVPLMGDAGLDLPHALAHDVAGLDEIRPVGGQAFVFRPGGLQQQAGRTDGDSQASRQTRRQQGPPRHHVPHQGALVQMTGETLQSHGCTPVAWTRAHAPASRGDSTPAPGREALPRTLKSLAASELCHTSASP